MLAADKRGFNKLLRDEGEVEEEERTMMMMVGRNRRGGSWFRTMKMPRWR